MTLYPATHPPFRHRQCIHDDLTQERIAKIARVPLSSCLSSALYNATSSRIDLEQLRAALFRVEQLVDREPVQLENPADDPRWLLSLVPALLESLEATKHCLEEWFESQTYRRIKSDEDLSV